MTYCYFARFYACCEWFVFRGALQRCRVAFLHQIEGKVLSVGEGDGRFSESLLAQKPAIDLKIIEPDETMRELIRKRIPEAQFTSLTEAPECDVIVLNFVLDLFTPADAEAFLHSLPPTKTLIVGDFFPEEVRGTLKRSAAQTLVWVMYRFFNLVTKLKTNSLPPIREILESHGWALDEKHVQWGGLIQAQRWVREDGLG